MPDVRVYTALPLCSLVDISQHHVGRAAAESMQLSEVLPLHRYPHLEGHAVRHNVCHQH